jgi:hypothetical protein
VEEALLAAVLLCAKASAVRERRRARRSDRIKTSHAADYMTVPERFGFDFCTEFSTSQRLGGD